MLLFRSGLSASVDGSPNAFANLSEVRNEQA
jgi:hypothetical protein